MTDKEFDVLDELYFLTSFQELQENCGIPSDKLASLLWEMITKEWINCFKNYDQEFVPEKDEFQAQFGNYHYLASKKGLLKHNAR